MGSLLATLAGLPGKDATAAQLRALPADKLPQLGVYSVDGRMEPENGTTAMEAGRMADVPLLIGWTDFDGSSPRGASARRRREQRFRRAKGGLRFRRQDRCRSRLSDVHRQPCRRSGTVDRRQRHPAARRSYLYLFSYVRTENRGKVRGAAHGDDITFVFDNGTKPPRSSILATRIAPRRA